MAKNYHLPAVVWLKATDYTHAWLQDELGGEIRIKDQRVISVQHLPGARQALRMETVEDMMERKPIGRVLSATRKNCFEAGVALDAEVMEKEYGVTKEMLQTFVPLECPRMCLTKNGVLRPWTSDVAFSDAQAKIMQRILRDAFWEGVELFAGEYARRHAGEKYAAVQMVEEFCRQTHTPDTHIEAIRREWQRRAKRQAST